jgi:hypothetical protein
MMLVSFCGRALFLLVVLATFVLAAQDYYKELGGTHESSPSPAQQQRPNPLPLLFLRLRYS